MFEYKDREIYLVCGCKDMRKGIDGLSAIVSLRLACDSFKPIMFVFSLCQEKSLGTEHKKAADPKVCRF